MGSERNPLHVPDPSIDELVSHYGIPRQYRAAVHKVISVWLDSWVGSSVGTVDEALSRLARDAAAGDDRTTT